MLEPLERLVQQSVGQIRAGLVPPLLTSGVRYRKEPRGVEEWMTALETSRRGHGDCEDLAIWLSSELRARNRDQNAKVVIKLVRPGLMHALVASRGALLDPSKLLGMKGPA
jgi:hypothetical protein